GLLYISTYHSVELVAWQYDHLTQPNSQASATANIANQLAEFPVETCQHLVIGMPKVDGEGSLAGHLVETTWARRDAANRRHGRCAHELGHSLGSDDYPGRAGKGGMAPGHGQRARAGGH